MKIAIFSLGSRGDVQPFLALAVGLQQAGHRATLAAPHKFAEWIQSYGVTAHPVRLDPQEFMQKPEVQAIMKSGNVLRQLSLMRGDMSKMMMEGLGDYWQAARDSDFVVGRGAGLGGVEVASQPGRRSGRRLRPIRGGALDEGSRR